MVDFAAHTARIIKRLGQPVTVTPSGQAARVVIAVYSETPAEAFGAVSGFAPTLRIAAGDIGDLSEGDAVTVGAKSFVIGPISDDSADSGDRVFRLESA